MSAAFDSTGPNSEQANNKKRMLEALKDSHGIITRACQIAQVGRTTFYEWLEADANFKAEYEAINEGAIDFVESKLFERINGVTVTNGVDKEGNDLTYQQPPSDTAIIFYLKTKAKKRGYVERTEVDATINLLKVEVVRKNNTATPGSASSASTESPE